MFAHTLASTELGTTLATEICSPHAGPRIVVVGGHHGDEPAGYALVGLLTVYARARKGALFLIPQANPGACLCHKRWDMRGQSLDLNRCYRGSDNFETTELKNYPRSAEVRHAEGILKAILAWSPDLVLDLHESPVFANPPKTDPGTGATAWTISCGPKGQGLAPDFLPHVSFNERGSLLSALESYGIAALAVETRKALSFQERIRTHLMAVAEISHRAGGDLFLPVEGMLASVS